MTKSPLEEKFDGAMFDIYRRAKSEAGYNATAFLGMITDRGGVATAKTLINADKQSDGFTALHMAGKLELTVEAMVLNDARWRELFTEEELQRAEKRLRRNGYAGSTPE